MCTQACSCLSNTLFFLQTAVQDFVRLLAPSCSMTGTLRWLNCTRMCAVFVYIALWMYGNAANNTSTTAATAQKEGDDVSCLCAGASFAPDKEPFPFAGRGVFVRRCRIWIKNNNRNEARPAHSDSDSHSFKQTNRVPCIPARLPFLPRHQPPSHDSSLRMNLPDTAGNDPTCPPTHRIERGPYTCVSMTTYKTPGNTIEQFDVP